MLSNEHIALQWAKTRQAEFMEERKNDRLLKLLHNELDSQARVRKEDDKPRATHE